MGYQNELEKAQQLEQNGKYKEAARLYEQLGTKMLREEGVEDRKTAARIIAKAIAQYLFADELEEARSLAFQVLFLKEEDPFLSLQIEAAISPKRELIRLFFINEIPKSPEEHFETLKGIPQNHKILKMSKALTVKKMWEWTIFGEIKEAYDLINLNFANPKDMIDFILSTRIGVTLVAAETDDGKEKLLVQIALTLNDPLEVVKTKQTGK